jgi:hypothetical protein
MLAGGSFHMRDRGYAWLAGALSRAIESAVAQTPVASITWISRTKQPRPGPAPVIRRGSPAAPLSRRRGAASNRRTRLRR